MCKRNTNIANVIVESVQIVTAMVLAAYLLVVAESIFSIFLGAIAIVVFTAFELGFKSSLIKDISFVGISFVLIILCNVAYNASSNYSTKNQRVEFDKSKYHMNNTDIKYLFCIDDEYRCFFSGKEPGSGFSITFDKDVFYRVKYIIERNVYFEFIVDDNKFHLFDRDVIVKNNVNKLLIQDFNKPNTALKFEYGR
jgi:hypothetical protein